MRLLAVETSSNACSVALQVDGEVIEDHVVEPRAHTRILMPMISNIFASAGLVPADLDAVVLGNGPGSFIGMRIGASVVQGICFAAGLNVVPVSSLAAVAAETLSANNAGRVVVTQDARMREVYVGIYRRGESGLPVAETGEFISSIDGLDIGAEPCLAAGDGWNRYPELAERAKNFSLGEVDIQHPRARCLLEIAIPDLTAAIPPDQLVPAYLRQKVADKPTASA
jgi:tRNA threonylcarbamoyladenosine biosynthesis protein TsaB